MTPMGLPDHDPEELVAAILQLASAGEWEAAEGLLAGEPARESVGAPPRPGLEFDRARHRWVRPGDADRAEGHDRELGRHGEAARSAARRFADRAVAVLADYHGRLIAAGVDPADVIDTVEDWGLPWKGSAAKGYDAVGDALGIDAWTATQIVPRVLAYGVLKMRDAVRSLAAREGDESGSDPRSVKAEAVAAVLAELAAALGVPEELRPTAADVLARENGSND